MNVDTNDTIPPESNVTSILPYDTIKQTVLVPLLVRSPSREQGDEDMARTPRVCSITEDAQLYVTLVNRNSRQDDDKGNSPGSAGGTIILICSSRFIRAENN